MLFFFELFLFVLSLLTLALAEFVSRALALGVWLICTVASLGVYVLASRSLSRPASPASSAEEEPDEVPTQTSTSLDEKWSKTLLYNWRRTNVLLLLGGVAVAAWYWLGAAAS